jgi:hypothetical protein
MLVFHVLYTPSLQKKAICPFDGSRGWKIHNQLNRTAIKWKKKRQTHIGKELEAHSVQKGPLRCDSYATQVGNARSYSSRLVKMNRRKTNRRKTRPYCIHTHMCMYTAAR